MSDENRGGKPTKQKRYLVEVRGVLHVNAPDGEAAYNAALAWIEAVSSEKWRPSDTEMQMPDAKEETAAVRVGWLRPFPE